MRSVPPMSMKMAAAGNKFVLSVEKLFARMNTVENAKSTSNKVRFMVLFLESERYKASDPAHLEVGDMFFCWNPAMTVFSYLTRLIAATNRPTPSASGTYPTICSVVPVRFAVDITSCATGIATAPMTITATMMPIPWSTRLCPALSCVQSVLSTTSSCSSWIS